MQCIVCKKGVTRLVYDPKTNEGLCTDCYYSCSKCKLCDRYHVSLTYDDYIGNKGYCPPCLSFMYNCKHNPDIINSYMD